MQARHAAHMQARRRARGASAHLRSSQSIAPYTSAWEDTQTMRDGAAALSGSSSRCVSRKGP